MSDVLYRYDAFFTGGGRDDYGDMVPRYPHLTVTEYYVRKRTPKGVWVSEALPGDNVITTGGDIPRFILLSARKRHCYETAELALASFVARKKKQCRILARQIDDLRSAIALAEITAKRAMS